MEKYIPKSVENLNEAEIERKRKHILLMTQVLYFLTNEFLSRKFQWLLPVIFSKSTDPLWPDPGASIEKRIETDVYETQVRTTLSMIVHKMVACSLFAERLFVISPNFRVERRERASTGWHAYEFNQLDFEMRDATSRDVMRTVEEVLTGLAKYVGDKCEYLIDSEVYDALKDVRGPFEIRDRDFLVSEYGDNWEEVLPKEIKRPVWVVNIPREFYDFEDFETGRWDNYDLYVPKYGEILSGARREFEYEKIVAKMERDGIRKENYSVLLKLSRDGKLKRSSGAGIGIERLVTWISGAHHVCETQLFPRVPGIVYEL